VSIDAAGEVAGRAIPRRRSDFNFIDVGVKNTQKIANA
jgi:hypothetical protein